MAESTGFRVVRHYVGHGIGHKMHEDPSILNYGKQGTGTLLEEGMVLALEPMINLGGFQVKDGTDGWLVKTADGSPSVHFEKTVAITSGDPIILTP